MSSLAKSPNPELIGKRVGRLVVVKYAGYFDVGSQKQHKWQCQCDCGNTVDVPKQRLEDTTRTRSCGCYRDEYLKKGTADRLGKPHGDLVGKRFGRLKVLSFAGVCPDTINLQQKRYLWQCQCECGNVTKIRTEYLTRSVNPAKSCGSCPKPIKLVSKPRNAVHRLPTIVTSLAPRSKSVAAKPSVVLPPSSDLAVWLQLEYESIYRRCNDEEHKYYHLFGGSGITLVWDNPDCFAEWIIKNLGSKPVGTKILRIDRYGNFEPRNLKWATI